MKENVDKQLDDLNRKVMGTSSGEQPSSNFTQNLMTQIHSLNRSSLFRYKPLIATPVWVGLAVLVVTVFGYVFIATSETASETKKNLALNAFLEHNLANPFSGLEMSQAGVYAVVLFCLMLCIQIPILKHYLDKRY
jgi:hypothetical protein